MIKDLYTINEYGSIYIELQSIMDAKKITRNRLSRAIGARYEVIDKWYKGNIEKIDTDVLARICWALDCEPSDIIKYRPDNEKTRT